MLGLFFVISLVFLTLSFLTSAVGVFLNVLMAIEMIEYRNGDVFESQIAKILQLLFTSFVSFLLIVLIFQVW